MPVYSQPFLHSRNLIPCAKHTLQTLAIFFTLQIASPIESLAQNHSDFIGMKHLMITPDAVVQEQEQKQNENNSSEKNTKEPMAKTKEPPKEYLAHEKDFKSWDKLSLAAYAHKKEDIESLLKNIDLDKEIISPQGFFLSAKSLSDAGKMDSAALYFLIGQLRMEFDMARWPARPDADYEKREKENETKSDDQKQPVGNKPKPENQHAFVMDLSASIGHPIFDWLASHPKEFKFTLDNVKKWDLETPYAYDPGYDLANPIPYEDWPKALESTRKSYFQRMTEIQQALAGYIKE